MKDVCLFGDCRDSMRKMIADGVKVQTCVTSPPYWGLRDYGTATWQGGEAGCDHLGPPMRTNNKPSDSTATFHGGTARANEPYRDLCGKCGARRIDSQLGLESTPDEYVTNMVEVFGLVRELLADDGTLWLNLGDSYAAGKQGNDSFGDSSSTLNNGGRNTKTGERMKSMQRRPPDGLKPKDLVGIPWRVAFALQADGWYLRSDIIWHKPNPMPESVTDRPTKAHEYLFLLAKRERYYYDADAIKEVAIGNDPGNVQPHKYADMSGVHANLGAIGPVTTRNRRTVWTVATEPYSEAHFATFPTALIEPCILAGSRVGDTVFDPFMGSGTTGQVAQNLGRHWLGCELNDKYGDLQSRRTNQMGLELVA